MNINADALLDMNRGPGPYSTVLMLDDTVLTALDQAGSTLLTASSVLQAGDLSQPPRLLRPTLTSLPEKLRQPARESTVDISRSFTRYL